MRERLYNAVTRVGKTYYVYIMSNQSRTLYVGVTDNIQRRVWQHKTKVAEGFTSRYRIDTLVYMESYGDVWCALEREADQTVATSEETRSDRQR